MESFYTYVLSIAIIILIVFLTVIGILMKYQNQNTIFPPHTNTCPDYWTSDGTTCYIPSVLDNTNTNILNTGTFKGSGNTLAPYNTIQGQFSPTDIRWDGGGLSRICAQKKWALTNNIIWDGVTNYNKC